MFSALIASLAASFAALSAAAFSAFVGVSGGRIASAASGAIPTVANASDLISHRLPLYSATSAIFRCTAALVRSGREPFAWAVSRKLSLAPLLWSLGLRSKNSTRGLTRSSGNSLSSSGLIASASSAVMPTEASTSTLTSHRCGAFSRYSATSAIFRCTAALVRSGREPFAWAVSRKLSLAPLLGSLGLASKNSTSGLRSSSGNSTLRSLRARSPSSPPSSAFGRFSSTATVGSYTRMAALVPGRNRTGASARSTSRRDPDSSTGGSTSGAPPAGSSREAARSTKPAMTSGWCRRRACLVHCTSRARVRSLNPLESGAPGAGAASGSSSSEKSGSARSIGSSPHSTSLTPSPSDSSPSLTTNPSSSSSDTPSPSSSSTSSSERDSPSSISSHSSPESKCSPSSVTYSTSGSRANGRRPVTARDTDPGLSGNVPDPQNGGLPPSTGNVFANDSFRVPSEPLAALASGPS
mmetsp:Transcript_3219/g.14399  ORF Transcript_3219/g.14399 Transcript_3219/m.14399 type:complete len:468 (-) Transcript_3219:785-2188(-)